MIHTYLARALAGLVVLALGLSSCVESERGDGNEGDTFVFGTAGAPQLFDPFYANDTETFRVTRQIYEGLLSLKPGTAEAAPGLATEWSSSEDGLTWTFSLRKGVTFHDGTKFDASAVCANFSRWYNQKGAAQNVAVSENWINVFGGFANDDEKSLYKSCRIKDQYTVVIKLTRATSRFPIILSHPSFAISSPTALKKYNANDVSVEGSGFSFPSYATAHPIGTGPFKFAEHEQSNGQVALKRNENYWGEPAKVDNLIFQAIPDEPTRRQELQAGSIDGYDLPNPVDWAALEDGGNKVLVRPAFNILYVGLNATHAPELKDFRVRQALLYAIDREELVTTQLPEAAEVASQMMPKTVDGYNEDLDPYPYDPEKAEKLLAEAGHENLAIDFWYPTEVTRPYMPDPKRVFEAIRADWESVGITVNPVAKPWNGGYLTGRDQGKAPAYVLGGTGDYNTAYNFIGAFFGLTDNAFDTGLYDFGEQLASDLKTADSEPDEAKRESMFMTINRQIVEEYLPALPIAHSPPALVVSGHVEGLVPSPVSAEDFSTVTVGN